MNRRCRVKVLRCKDLDVPCDFVARASDEKEVFRMVSEHAKNDHDLDEVTDETLSAWRKAIREE